MSVRYWFSKEVLQPRGAWSNVDQVLKGFPSRAFLAQNVRFSPGKVYSRPGTSIRAAVAGQVTGLYNWLTSSQNIALFLENGGANQKLRKLTVSSGVATDLVTGLSGVRGIRVAESGPRAYVSFFNTSALGAGQCYVTDGSAINDKAFEPPLVFTASSAADSGAGLCTQGPHKIGFIFQSRSGFSGLPSPAPADVFTPLTVTLNAGKRTIHVSITLNTPAAAGTGSAIYLIMTRADNPDKWYFVPGLPITILPPSAAGWTQTWDVSVTDEDLADRGEDADPYFSRLAQKVAGTGPISPSVVFPYRHRVVYIVDQKAYISEIDDAQGITEDQNVQQVPGQKRIITGFELNETLYLLGDKFTASTSDNGDLPVTWEQPKEIAQIGTSAPNGVEPRTAGSYAWVASERGLWIFQGVYDPYHPGEPKPITYYCAEWARINWNAAYAIQVVDDVKNLKCYVAAPLDAATEPSHLFVIDYTNGLTYDTCDISVDTFSSGAFSAICIAKETADSQSKLWIGPAAAGNILVSDPTTHNDNGAAVHSLWKSGFIREQGEIESNLIRVGNAHIRARGNGNLIHTWSGLDGQLVVTPAVLALSANPGKDLFTKFDLHPVEQFTATFETDAVGAWFELEMVKPYFRKSLFVR